MMPMNERKVKYALALSIILLMGIASTYYFLYNQSVKIRISTTTSLYATGLLDYLYDEFKENHSNVVVQFIAVGSGAALKLAEQGDVDMVFVHAPNLEADYIKRGIITNHTIFAYNYFIIVGPKSDPAHIANLTPIEAMKSIYNSCENGQALFISRGDQSGTHQRELLLWNLSGLNPFNKSWYIETGSGMSETLLVANEKNAYTISDIGTFLKLKGDGRLPNLVKLVDKGKILINIYSAYIVETAKTNSDTQKVIKSLMKFILSDTGQELIGSFGVDKYGQPLFYPAKGHEDELREIWQWFVDLAK